MRFQLSAADRERLGAPEWVDYDPSKMTNREAAQLQRAGYDPPQEGLAAAWVAQQPDPDGPLRIDFDVWTAVVWMALRRAGVTVPYDELEFDAYGITVEPPPEPEVGDEGKDRSTLPETSGD